MVTRQEPSAAEMQTRIHFHSSSAGKGLCFLCLPGRRFLFRRRVEGHGHLFQRRQDTFNQP